MKPKAEKNTDAKMVDVFAPNVTKAQRNFLKIKAAAEVARAQKAARKAAGLPGKAARISAARRARKMLAAQTQQISDAKMAVELEKKVLPGMLKYQSKVEAEKQKKDEKSAESLIVKHGKKKEKTTKGQPTEAQRRLRNLRKKLRELDAVQEPGTVDEASLNEEQRARLARKAELREKERLAAEQVAAEEAVKSTEAGAVEPMTAAVASAATAGDASGQVTASTAAQTPPSTANTSSSVAPATSTKEKSVKQKRKERNREIKVQKTLQKKKNQGIGGGNSRGSSR